LLWHISHANKALDLKLNISIYWRDRERFKYP
jgi:hypothetical protein